jgi:hypothetical protein
MADRFNVCICVILKEHCMKKKILTGFIILTAVFSVYSQSGTIRELTGEVELKPAGAASFTPARVGSPVARDTIVSTGFRSSAIIEVGSNVITVRPLTRLSLSDIQSAAGTETVNVQLQAGRIRVEVNPPAGTRANTTVHTPTATASVRGTEFDMDTRNIMVQYGNVSFGGSDGLMVPVTSGGSNSISSGGSAQNPLDVATGEITPNPPAGTNEAGASASSGESSSTSIDIEIDWGNPNGQ